MTALTEAKPAFPGTAYEDDFYTWTQEQGARLRAGHFDGIDRDTLAEEIEGLGRSQFAALTSALRIVLLHMLQFDHQPSQRTRGWASSIAAHRNSAAQELKDSPGLKGRLGEAIERAYYMARLEASEETGLPLKRLPKTCSYTFVEIATREFAIDEDGTA